MIVNTLTGDGLQNMLDYIVATGEPFGLRLSTKKCELICFHRPGTVDKSTLAEVSVAGEILKWKSSVVYLGSCISEDGKMVPAIKHRICCAESVVECLNKRVFRRRSVPARLKGKFLGSAVFASLLYGLEHCALGARDKRRLDGFFIRLAKCILHLIYDFHLSYEAAEEQLGFQRPSVLLVRNRLRWAGHMLRSEDVVLREVLAYVPGGHRLRGRPRLRFFDTIKADLAERTAMASKVSQDIFWELVADKAADRTGWQR